MEVVRARRSDRRGPRGSSSLDELEESVVVVCAGPWARRLLEPAGIDLPGRRDARDRRLLRARRRDPVRRRRDRDLRARLLLAPRSGSWSEGRPSQARHARRPGRRRRPGPGARGGDRRVDAGALPARESGAVGAEAASTPPPTTSGSSSSATAGSSSARPAPATPSSSLPRPASGSPRSRSKRSN